MRSEASKIRGSLPGAVHGQELVFEKKRLRDQGTDAARPEQAGQGRDEMDGENHQIASQKRRRTRNLEESWAK
jgi:hypothetical protein